MSEETQFWGVAVERYGQGGRPTNELLEYYGITPESKRFRGYHVFSSRERADRFVQSQWQTLSQELIEQTVANIRQIRRDEIPEESTFLSVLVAPASLIGSELSVYLAPALCLR